VSAELGWGWGWGRGRSCRSGEDENVHGFEIAADVLLVAHVSRLTFHNATNVRSVPGCHVFCYFAT
jgi:hypothetical protein